jgi:hypothetical protein
MMYLRDHEVTLYHYVHSFSQDGVMEDHFMLMRALRDSLRQFPFEIVYHVRQSLQDLSVDDDAFDVPPMIAYNSCLQPPGCLGPLPTHKLRKQDRNTLLELKCLAPEPAAADSKSSDEDNPKELEPLSAFVVQNTDANPVAPTLPSLAADAALAAAAAAPENLPTPPTPVPGLVLLDHCETNTAVQEFLERLGFEALADMCRQDRFFGAEYNPGSDDADADSITKRHLPSEPDERSRVFRAAIAHLVNVVIPAGREGSAYDNDVFATSVDTHQATVQTLARAATEFAETTTAAMTDFATLYSDFADARNRQAKSDAAFDKRKRMYDLRKYDQTERPVHDPNYNVAKLSALLLWYNVESAEFFRGPPRRTKTSPDILPRAAQEALYTVLLNDRQ